MPRKVALSAAVVAVIAAGAPVGASGSPPPRAAEAAGPRVTVKPRAGIPTTRFAVSFRAPDRTGAVGSFERRYEIDADLARARQRCVSGLQVGVPASAAGAHVKVTLNPAAATGEWCTGTFRGRIEELETPNCRPGRVCPAFVILLKTFGRFSFQVHARHR